jgi:hypothetical protein
MIAQNGVVKSRFETSIEEIDLKGQYSNGCEEKSRLNVLHIDQLPMDSSSFDIPFANQTARRALQCSHACIVVV